MRSTAKKIFKYLFRSLILILGLLLICLLLLQIPAVQQYLTGKIETYLQDRLQTEVEIKAIQLKFPQYLSLQGVYAEDEAGDTLVHVEALDVNFKLHQLRNKKIQFDRIILRGGRLNLFATADSTNYNFILQAFESEEKDVPPTVTDSSTTESWIMTFDDAGLGLEDIQFRMTDQANGFKIDTYVGNLLGEVQQVDYIEQQYQIDQLQLANSRIRLQLTPALVTKAETSDTLASPLYLSFNDLSLKQIDFAMQTETMEIATIVGELQLEDGLLFSQGDSLRVQSKYLKIDESQIAYDALKIKPLQGFDPNHFNFQELLLEVADLHFTPTHITANLLQGKVKEGNDFGLEELKGQVVISEQQAEIKALNLRSQHTAVQSPHFQIQYPILGGDAIPLGQLALDTDLQLDASSWSDLRYFYPSIDSLASIYNLTDAPLKLVAQLQGALDDLQITTLDFQGLDSRLQSSGHIRNATQVKRLQLALQQLQLQTKGALIEQLFPDSTLPQFVQLPDSLILNGQIFGSLQDLNTRLSAMTFRSNVEPPSRIKAVARLKNILEMDSLAMDIQLDTFATSRSDLLAYLPDSILPAYIRLPDEMVLTGTINGPVANLDSDLQLLTIRGQDASRFSALGKVSGLFTSDAPDFDLQLNASKIKQEEIAAFLPDSLLPAYFKLPLIKKLKGIFQGDLDHFNTQFQVESNTGAWSIDASLKQKKYQVRLGVDQLDPSSFFTPNYLDSLAGFSVRPLAMDFQLDGQGFDFSESSFADLLLTIKDAQDTSMTGLKVEAKLENQLLRARAFAEEEEVQLSAALFLDYSSKRPEGQLELDLDKLDLAALQWSQLPFQIKGKLEANLVGMDWKGMNGKAFLKDIDIRYDQRVERIDSLQLLVQLREKETAINLQSDLLDARVNGRIGWDSIQTVIGQYAQDLYLPDAPTGLIGSTLDSFTILFDLHRPEVLTMGWIPGLDALKPFKIESSLDNPNQRWFLSTRLPFIRYQGFSFEALSLEAEGQEQSLNYQLGFQKSNLNNIAYIDRFNTYGQFKDQALQNTIELRDAQQRQRFKIQSVLSFLKDQGIRFNLAEQQLLDYDEWKASESNSIQLGGQAIQVNNWILSNKDQSIQIVSQDKKDLSLAFEQFNLATIADMLNTKSQAFSGLLNGQLQLYDLFQQFHFTSNLRIDELVLFDAALGDLDLKAKNAKETIIDLDTRLKGNGNHLRLKGQYNWKDKIDPLNLTLDIPNLNMATIEPLTFGELKNMAGQLQAELQIEGSPTTPSLLGKAQFKNTAFDVGMLNARFKIGEQPIIFDANAIEFQNLEVLDANNQKGVVSSYILTEDYRDFFFQTNVEINDFLVLNTKAKDNELYYGKLLVDAKVNLGGSLSAPIVDVIATPQKNSDLTYVYNPYQKELVSHEGIVEFVSSLPKDTLKVQRPVFETASQELNMKVALKISVNSDLDFKVITDPLTGDYFKGKMEGDLVYIQQPDGRMELNGSLKAIEGEYLFTYQSLIRRPFEVVPGGTLDWTGDPFNPKLNIQVAYKVKASTYPLLVNQGVDEATAAGAGKQNFVVQLSIGGIPDKTEISTLIQYPQIDGNTNDSDIQSAITQINQDPSQQNTQAFALILFNGFISQNLGQSDFQILNLSGDLNNIITQQLNGLANRYIKFVELDFGIDSYENNENVNQTDFKVSVRKRFLNDRLVVNLDGKATTESGTEESTSQTYLDNVTVEYALTPNGRFKIKVYNKRDFDDFIGGTGVKVGGALIFSKDFNRIRLFKPKR